jgi:hypothetical protein
VLPSILETLPLACHFLDGLNQWILVKFPAERKNKSTFQDGLQYSHVIFCFFIFVPYLNHIYPFSYVKKAFLTCNVIQQQNTICFSEVRLGNTSESEKEKSTSSLRQLGVALSITSFMLIVSSSQSQVRRTQQWHIAVNSHPQGLQQLSES